MKIFFAILSYLLLLYPTKAQTLFSWPVRSMPSYNEIPNFYVTNNFVDQNMGVGVLDWNCGSRTYDGHGGIDIDLWPFTWSMMDNNHVAVVAAAPGRVVNVVDNRGNESNCAQPGEDGNWNFIAVRHADSSTAFYGHIRDNSAKVTIGQFVTTGQILAFVGSSGSSSNPHLHFEVNNTAVNTLPAPSGLIDPYSGSCNSINANTWWVSQKPYREPAVVRVMTHGARPSLLGFTSGNSFCRSGEVKNDKANFAPNDSIFFGVAMRDYLANQNYTLQVVNPSGGIFYNGAHTNTGSDLTKKYYLFNAKLPSNAEAGTWRATVSFNGTTVTHFFSVNCLSTQNVTGTLTGTNGFKTSNAITSTAAVNSGNKLLLQAGSKITLSPGFSARSGSVVNVRIRDCNYSE